MLRDFLDDKADFLNYLVPGWNDPKKAALNVLTTASILEELAREADEASWHELHELSRRLVKHVAHKLLENPELWFSGNKVSEEGPHQNRSNIRSGRDPLNENDGDLTADSSESSDQETAQEREAAAEAKGQIISSYPKPTPKKHITHHQREKQIHYLLEQLVYVDGLKFLEDQLKQLAVSFKCHHQ